MYEVIIRQTYSKIIFTAFRARPIQWLAHTVFVRTELFLSGFRSKVYPLPLIVLPCTVPLSIHTSSRNFPYWAWVPAVKQSSKHLAYTAKYLRALKSKYKIFLYPKEAFWQVPDTFYAQWYIKELVYIGCQESLLLILKWYVHEPILPIYIGQFDK